ncbi:hypothetical protein D3C76_1032150 [compost metagenome]
MLGATTGIGGPVVVEVVLGVDHAVGVFQLRPGPVLGVVVLGRWCVRDFGAGGVDHRAAVVDAQLLIAKIGGDAQPVTAIIQAEGDQL